MEFGGAPIVSLKLPRFHGHGNSNEKERTRLEAKRKHTVYQEEFRRQAVGMVIHGGKTQAQVAREMAGSEYSLNLWKKAYLRQQAPAEIDGQQKSPERVDAG
jgi:transposase-like protein